MKFCCYDWLKSNEIIQNPFKFRAVTIGNKDKCTGQFEIDNEFTDKIEKHYFK